MQPERNLVIRLAVGLELLGWNWWFGGQRHGVQRRRWRQWLNHQRTGSSGPVQHIAHQLPCSGPGGPVLQRICWQSNRIASIAWGGCKCHVMFS